jgi:hypothetical protein
MVVCASRLLTVDSIPIGLLQLATTARTPSHPQHNTANMVSTLVPPKVCSAVENLVNTANREYRSPLPTYVLLSPLPFPSE